MVFLVLLCFLVTVLTPSCGTQVHREIRYECGPHGKFEYCTDDEPGCVVGCHCHPGYYFDTETKICELNVKLTQNYRQQYVVEPVHTYNHPTVTTIEPSFSTAAAYFNEKDNDINKDTDGIGDWLYNQFFKAIENQVINNSNNTKSIGDVKPETRRSEGGGPVINKGMKKSRKSVNRSRKKKKHMKGRKLKKLLRISEDDSLFDSNSDSGSSYSDSDDSSGSSSGSSDESSSSNDEKKSSCGDSSEHKDHGHKKVIIFNRRPKPPLPSFIFVPNDTPYYPPIGLPPPPLLPMFPMPMVPPPPPPIIPLPPPPIIPLPPIIPAPSVLPSTPAPPQNNNNGNTNNTTTTADPNNNNPNGRRDRTEKPHKNLKGVSRASEPRKQKSFKHGSKSRLMQRIMEKLKIQRRNNLSPEAKLLDKFQDQDYLDIDDISNSMESYTPHKTTPKEDQEEEKENMPELDDVDFKYLSELIHGVNKSTARRRSLYKHNNDLREPRKLGFSYPSRRSFDADYLAPQPDRQSTDDVYYSNLGRQMASMVRDSESVGFPRFTKNLEYVNREVPFHSVLNENNVPRSLWERSVRSLPPRHGKMSEYLDESRTLKHSNEKSLINLENEVEIVASTPRSLSLQELENILNTVQEVHAHIKFRQPLTNTKQSNISMNVNLLPKHIKSTCLLNTLCETSKKVEHQTHLPRVHLEPIPVPVANRTSVFHEPKKQFNRDYWTYNLKVEPIKPTARPKPVFDQTTSTTSHDIIKPHPKKQAFINVVQPKRTEPKPVPRGQYLHFQNRLPFAKPPIPKINEAKVVNYNSLNYYTGNKHYQYEAAPYPVLTPYKQPFNRNIRNQIFNKPSYFHPRFQHFEYFN